MRAGSFLGARRAPGFWRTRGPLALLLAPLGMLYGLSVAWKARRQPTSAPVPVICIGNLTAGGSGKTPIAIAIAQVLKARGVKPFFLTRGYGGRARGPVLASRAHSAEEMGDEALLLARHAPTMVARDRALGARLAVDRGADVIVMDDGHQNFTLAKTLSLVVVDGETGFGNGLMIPAGPLREPVTQGLGRADAVVIVGDGAPGLGGFAGPVLRAHLVADGEGFAGQRVFAFAGIGRPEKFVASMDAGGAVVVGQCFFADHHPYTDDEIVQLKALAGDAVLVTTQKDFVRLSIAQRETIRVLKINAVFDDPGALDRLLDRLGKRV